LLLPVLIGVEIASEIDRENAEKGNRERRADQQPIHA
jgi:hypothetical protein